MRALIIINENEFPSKELFEKLESFDVTVAGDMWHEELWENLSYLNIDAECYGSEVGALKAFCDFDHEPYNEFLVCHSTGVEAVGFVEAIDEHIFCSNKVCSTISYVPIYVFDIKVKKYLAPGYRSIKEDLFPALVGLNQVNYIRVGGEEFSE